MEVTPEQLGHVRRRVAQGDYRVNSERVAAAMLEKIGAMVIGREIGRTSGRTHLTEVHDRRAA
jgi:hypothetical protein